MKKQMTLNNNETIQYMDIGTSEKVLVLIHGNMSSGLHYQPLFELLEGYRLIVPDMRGFGDSTYNVPIESLEDLADDLLELLDKIQISSYSVAGWSTGGAVALKMASKDKRVQRVVLIESCSYRGYPIFKKDENGAPMIGHYYDNKEDMALDPVQVKPMVDVFESGNSPVMSAVWDQLIYTVNKPSPEQAELFMSETMKQRNLVDIDWALTTFNMSNFSNGVSNGDNSINDVEVPVLSLWGDKDIVVLEYMIDETVEALKNAKKVILPNSGHSPLIDCPNELANQIKKFL